MIQLGEQFSSPFHLTFFIMTKQHLIGQLRIGKNGEQILDILEQLVSGMDSGECIQDITPTLDEIEF